MREFTVLDLLDLDLREHNHLQLKCIAGRSGLSRTIKNSKISRPGLALTGYFEDFSGSSIQLIGRAEQSYIEMLEKKNEYENIERIFSYEPPCIVFIGGYKPSEHFVELAEKNATAILSTPLESSDFSRRLYSQLDEVFAATMTIHGVLVDVYGVGVLIMGESGIGKSEAALELIKRGHRLVTDDVVEIRKVSDDTLVGSAPDITRHFIELRGIGIVDVKSMFGVQSVRDTQNIDLVITLEDWDRDKEYDRLGLEEEYIEFLGNKVVCHSLPIRPGRNLAIIVEAAAVNHRQKKMGYNAAQELYKRVQANLVKKREGDR